MERRARWRDAGEGTGRLVLGFDAGCGRCMGLAKRIRRCVGDRLEVGDLRSARARRWRGRALGDDAPLVPTLFEVRGRKVRAWVGIEMGLVLAQRLGVADSLKVLQALGDARRRAEVPADGVPTGSKLRLVRSSVSDAYRGATLATSVPRDAAGTNSHPSHAHHVRALGIVEGSRDYGAVVSALGAQLDLERAVLAVDDSGEFVGIVASGSGGNTRAFAVFVVDLHRGAMDASRHLTVTAVRGERYVVNHRDGVPGETLGLGDDYVVLPDGTWVTPEEFEAIANQQEPVRSGVERDVLYGERARSGCLDRSYEFCMRVDDLYNTSWHEGLGLDPLGVAACDYLTRRSGAAMCRAWARTRCYLGPMDGA